MRAARQPGPAFSILLVEDDQSTRDVYCLMIRTRFPACTVFKAQDGVNGVELFKKHCPDIVITDLDMPAMNGLDMVREIKTVKGKTQFIVLTAHGKEPDQENLLKLGCCSYIAKPVNFEGLFAAITKSLDAM